MKNLVLTLGSWFLALSSVYAQALQPSSQPTNLQFASVKYYSFVLSFTTTTADGYLILKSDRFITDTPSDGISYEKGQGLSSCKVMYAGANAIHNVREVLEGTKYYFKIFAFNGTGSNINYLQTNPLSDSVSTPAADEGNYYAPVDSTSGSFISNLTTVVNNHTMVAYTSYKYNIVPALFERDTTGGKVVVNCEYSNETTVYTPPFDFVALNYSREHAICKSWMKTSPLYGSNITDYPEGADYFNLLLTRLDSVNSYRSNFALGVPVTGIKTQGEFTYGFDANGKKVYQPMQNRRGDAARAMFYEMICYNGTSGNWGLNNLLSFATDQDQSILKLWNKLDPPDKFERTKNEYIYSIQHNRNPFIDHPAWAECINFDSLVKTNLCGVVSAIEENELNTKLNVYPNPASHFLTVELLGIEFQEAEVSLYDVYGREIMKSEIRNQKSEINTAFLQNGNYVLKMTVNGKSSFRRIAVLN